MSLLEFAELPPIRSLASDIPICAVTKVGEVYCWGEVSSNVERCDPTPTKVPGISNVIEVAVSMRAMCALTADNSVYCWGDDPLNQRRGSFIATPLQLPELNGSVRIRGSDGAFVALKADGDVWHWGSTIDYEEDTRPRRAELSQAAVDIFAGDQKGCALLQDRSIKCFGYKIERWVKKNKWFYPSQWEPKEVWVNAQVRNTGKSPTSEEGEDDSQ